MPPEPVRFPRGRADARSHRATETSGRDRRTAEDRAHGRHRIVANLRARIPPRWRGSTSRPSSWTSPSTWAGSRSSARTRPRRPSCIPLRKEARGQNCPSYRSAWTTWASAEAAVRAAGAEIVYGPVEEPWGLSSLLFPRSGRKSGQRRRQLDRRPRSASSRSTCFLAGALRRPATAGSSAVSSGNPRRWRTERDSNPR